MADNAKDSQLIELKDTITELKNLIKTLQNSLDAANEREAAYQEEKKNFLEQIDYLTKRLYGASSEKRKDDYPGQLSFFDELECSYDPSIAEKEAEILEEELSSADSDNNSKKKRKTNAQRFHGVPVKKVILKPDPEDMVCSRCGGEMKLIGTELVRREIEYRPARFRIIEYYSENYICNQCSNEGLAPVIVKGKDGRAHMLYGMASASTVAWIIYQKFVNSIPLYRQEKDWKQYGVDITRATLSSWVIKNADAFLKPVYDYLHRKLLEREFIMADETPVQVLHEEGRRPQTKSYMWLFRSGEDGTTPIILYKYSPTRAGDTAVNFLDGFKGYLMCDGYSGYNKVPDAKRLACWAHVRRYLIDAIPKGKQYDYSLPAVQGVMYCNRLFQLEESIKKKYKDYDAIKKARLEKEKPVLEAFWSWFDSLNPTKNSRLDKAAVYIRNRREYLQVYLEDGRCSFSNNASENAIRPFTVGRKNWLFSDTVAGADASAVAYSIVETAKANDINIYHYLQYLLEKLPYCSMSDKDLELLMPWQEDVKSEIQARINISNEDQ